ncbi:MAG: DUF433 domain-containing protein [Armatimonadetes bacterium]|nr:DUF433 domain-containing protein [Armatimonadota bacterium]
MSVEMAPRAAGSSHVVETPRGLTLAGTRITLYAILDCLHEGWTAEQIAAWFRLPLTRVQGALVVIEANRDAVDAQYRQVLRQAEENRRYWEERLRERLQSAPRLPDSPGRARIRERLAEQRKRLESW